MRFYIQKQKVPVHYIYSFKGTLKVNYLVVVKVVLQLLSFVLISESHKFVF